MENIIDICVQNAEMAKEIQRWLCENDVRIVNSFVPGGLKPEWTVDCSYESYPSWDNELFIALYAPTLIAFENEKDALQFKLVWG